MRHLLQVSFVGMTEEQARAKAEEGGWADKVAVQKTSFKANSKALAEKESEGIAKMIYRCDRLSRSRAADAPVQDAYISQEAQ